jgi:hypothetical protein
MSKWNKLFSDRNKVSTTATVKGNDGITRTVKPVAGATGLSNAAIVEAVRIAGATVSESLKEINDAGEEVNKRNTVKPGDYSPAQFADGAGELLGVSVAPTPAPKAPKAPAPNGTPAPVQ